MIHTFCLFQNTREREKKKKSFSMDAEHFDDAAEVADVAVSQEAVDGAVEEADDAVCPPVCEPAHGANH
ncbi:hypothetical protein BpHYR1_003077 [Brachionus plicatilis]|uniref:Uncharacterized protein n=1 Tax=Brachionus plicatilis TaxID=10195 RepID=A0A3M7QNA3_BRAPC|nr:hypothetical protein BpHYR1_003077 [Brachionus plicatilis]